jgi:hypothetical protein
MMYGDCLRDVYTKVSYGRYLAATLFLYSFVFFAICVVQNIFIIVMQESYFQARKFNIKDELLGQDFEDDNKEKDKISQKSNIANTPRKAAISKLTLSKMLKDDEEKSAISSKLPRSKSGFINSIKPMTLHLGDTNIHVEQLDTFVVSLPSNLYRTSKMF